MALFRFWPPEACSSESRIFGQKGGFWTKRGDFGQKGGISDKGLQNKEPVLVSSNLLEKVCQKSKRC